jgi:hypothetical protein
MFLHTHTPHTGALIPAQTGARLHIYSTVYSTVTRLSGHSSFVHNPVLACCASRCLEVVGFV